MEIFSSIQGEGQYIGKRQIFIRFAGCNINCKYCDTTTSKNKNSGKKYTHEQLNDKIQSLMTDDFHSLEITGGEPLLHTQYISEFLEKYPYRAMLETNATIPGNMRKLTRLIDIVSMDIKLPEHFETLPEWEDVYEKELETIDVLEESDTEYYIKIVVSPTTPIDVIDKITGELENKISPAREVIVQPVSPTEKWTDKDNLFKISQTIGKNFNVSIIPQIHKYMNVE